MRSMILANAAISNSKRKAQPIVFNPQNAGERRLVEAAKRGHSTAFSTLCERSIDQLLRATQRIAGSREDAEDAVQDALLKAYVHLNDFDGRSSFATWLTRIAINSALMILRKKRASREVDLETSAESDSGTLTFEIPDHAPNPERRYAQCEEKTILNRAIQNLRPALREVVAIQLQERSMREAARVLGISLSAAKARVFHARKALSKSSTLKMIQRRRPAVVVRVLSAA
jgi:RNA polymerase sigma-70 factor (ECF subfamily)